MSKSRTTATAWALLLGAALILSGWVWGPVDAAAPSNAAVVAAPAVPDALIQAPQTFPEGSAVGPVSAVPPGVTPGQWAQVQSDLMSRPGGAAEVRRLSRYLGWSDALKQLRQARSVGPIPPDLARKVEAGLDERVRQREVSAAEAMRIKSLVLEASVPELAEREPQLRQWAKAMFPAIQPDPRQAEFERRQSAIVTAWSAQPAPAHDQAALARQLDALRKQTFAPSASH